MLLPLPLLLLPLLLHWMSPQALCYDCEEDMIDALAQDPEKFRGKVVVIRYVQLDRWWLLTRLCFEPVEGPCLEYRRLKVVMCLGCSLTPLFLLMLSLGLWATRHAHLDHELKSSHTKRLEAGCNRASLE